HLRRRSDRQVARGGNVAGRRRARPSAVRPERAGRRRAPSPDPALPRPLAPRRSGRLPRRALGAVTVPLGNTGLDISPIGFGAWAVGGGGWDWGWGYQEPADSIGAIHLALERGVNWIDTAAQYGFGHSEEVVGQALEGLSERPFVFTKAGQPEGPGRTSIQILQRDSIRREIEGSLARL